MLALSHLIAKIDPTYTTLVFHLMSKIMFGQGSSSSLVNRRSRSQPKGRPQVMIPQWCVRILREVGCESPKILDKWEVCHQKAVLTGGSSSGYRLHSLSWWERRCLNRRLGGLFSIWSLRTAISWKLDVTWNKLLGSPGFSVGQT